MIEFPAFEVYILFGKESISSINIIPPFFFTILNNLFIFYSDSPIIGPNKSFAFIA